MIMSNDPAALLDMAPPIRPKLKIYSTSLQRCPLTSLQCAVKKLVSGIIACSYSLKKLVEACFSDEQIHAQADHLTTYGFTVPETREEVQKMINGARKGGIGLHSI